MDSQMTVGKKLTLIGALLIGLTIVLGIVTLVGLKSYDKSVHSLADDALAGVSACSKMESDFLEMRGDTWRHVASDDSSDMEHMNQEVQRLKSEIASENKDVQSAIYADEERALNQRIDPALQRYYDLWEKVRALSDAKKNEEAYKMLIEGTAIYTDISNSIHAETEYNRTLGTKYTAEALATGARLRWLTWLLLFIAVGLGSGSLYLFVRGLTHVLRQAVTELTEGAGQVASASAQVASSSQSLAQGSSEQAASLEETSASSEQITSMTQKNAENSSTAATLMTDVDQRVSEGNRTLEEMMQSMQEITGSSDKISKIIKVIDEIAFQTNILALNAAVEAARAGEAGMGFAVVADEVRSLAQRSAQAAKDTSALIEESITKSNEGSTRLQRVADVMRAITESTVKVKTLVDEVNLGSQEQARGIQQISKAITQMDQVTQSTAASAEQGASASEELSAQAEAMGQAVRKLSQMVDSDDQNAFRRPPPAKQVLASAVMSRKLSPPPASGAGLHALKSAVAKSPGAKLASRKPAPETPSDAEFLESFKEM
jgi:methyl-accepting chemotaxis protein/methyl-accepting chemotaxis protein-1 (serine sensor receptor)